MKSPSKLPLEDALNRLRKEYSLSTLLDALAATIDADRDESDPDCDRNQQLNRLVGLIEDASILAQSLDSDT